MGKARWKVASPKKLSARERGVFVDKKLSGSGLQFSKAGFCCLTNDVVCSYRKNPKIRMMDRCFECPELARFEHQMHEEEEKFFDEVDAIRRHFPV